MEKIHIFDNGIKVYDDQLLETQRKRYAQHNLHEKEEEEIFIKIIDGLASNATFVNVGTAIGYYPLLARKLRSDIIIHCFEPLPRHIGYFRKNIVLNGFAIENFKIHELAVATESGSAVLEDRDYGSSIRRERNSRSIRLVVKNSWAKITGKTADRKLISVKSIGLKDVFRVIGTQVVAVVQMDIQGFEEPVLKAFFADNHGAYGSINSFLLGTHGIEIHKNCRTMFEKNGYVIKHDEQDTENQPDGILYCTQIRQ